jgi:acyl carrier protein phosphodiesterase
VKSQVEWEQECQRIEEASVELHRKIDAMERANAQLKQERDDFRTAYLAINRIVDRR